MTLEEKAEAGYKSHAGEMGYHDGTRRKLYFDGFADGYSAAGNVIWHDLRKDPNDLPVRRCIDNNGNVVGLFRNSWDKKPTWYRYDFHECEWWQMETEPIAWCEVPRFVKEQG